MGRIRKHRRPYTREMIEQLSIPVPHAGCWIWVDHMGSHGYGVLGQDELAHRVSYEVFKGRIPRLLCVLHSCDTKLCVNPDHLSVGTHRQNMREAAKRNLVSKKLTPEKVRAIRDARFLGEATTSIGRRFGVTKQAVSQILSGRVWSHVK